MLGSAYTGLTGRLPVIRVIPSGDILVAEQDAARIVRVGADGRVEIGVANGPMDIAVNHAGTSAFVSCSIDSAIDFIDLRANRTTSGLRLPMGSPLRLALSADESRLYVTTSSGTVYAVNTVTHEIAAAKALTRPLQALSVDAMGRMLFVAGASGVIWQLDPVSLAVRDSTILGCTPEDVTLARDGAELYVACSDAGLLVLDSETLAGRSSIPLSLLGGSSVAVSPDDAQLYITGALSGRLTIVTRESRSIARTLFLSGRPRGVAFTLDGRKAFVANEESRIDVIE